MNQIVGANKKLKINEEMQLLWLVIGKHDIVLNEMGTLQEAYFIHIQLLEAARVWGDVTTPAYILVAFNANVETARWQLWITVLYQKQQPSSLQ